MSLPNEMTKQLCSACDEPTGRCAEDSMRGENGAVLCEECVSGMWWCDWCGVHVDGSHVTCEEAHDSRSGGCGRAVTPNEQLKPTRVSAVGLEAPVGREEGE